MVSWATAGVIAALAAMFLALAAWAAQDAGANPPTPVAKPLPDPPPVARIL